MLAELIPLRKRMFTVGDVEITVRAGIGMDIFDANAIYPQLSYNRRSKRMVTRASAFVDALLRSTIDGDLGFAWPDVDDDDTGLQAAFEGWQALPKTIITAWSNALYLVNQTTDPNE